MFDDTRNDECLICYASLLKGINLWRLLYADCLCYQCRKLLENKLRRTVYNGYDLYYFYEYNLQVKKLLLQFKDYFDTALAPLFLAPYNLFLNEFFKDYAIVLIPSSPTLIKRRGFNHLTLMLDKCQLAIYDILIKSDSIQRFSTDRSLVTFSFKHKPQKFKKVIIFDDVISSGYSFNKVIELIKPYADKIVLVSVINNLSDER